MSYGEKFNREFMMIEKLFKSAVVFIAAAFIAGCSAPIEDPVGPSISTDIGFYKDEGAHFELPAEFWSVTGRLESESGPYFFTAYFHKAGNPFIHSRTGYNSLRAPDGRYDFRSFGDGLSRRLAENALNDKIVKFPEDERYPALLSNLREDESEHFDSLDEEERGLYRNRLYIDFGNNHFERESVEKLEYSLRLGTWAGALDLKMEATTDPLTFSAKGPLRIGEGMMQGYFFPRMTVAGTLKDGDSELEVSGTAWYNHVFGRPGNQASARHEIITQRLETGGAFVIANYYNNNNELMNTNVAYLNPEGKITRDWTISIKPVKSWKSDISRFSYPVAWKISGDDISGTVEPLFDEAEVMLEEGVGSFWMGPCVFKGKMGTGLLRNKVNGDGFCRIVGTEEKPGL